MTRRDMLGLAAVSLLGGCGLFYPSSTLRYRMTVEVDTPQGPRTGSSVIESTISDGMKFGDASGITYGLKGEAVMVDLPGRRTLFALLRSEGDMDTAGYHRRLVSHSLQQGAVSVPAMPRIYRDNEWAEERRMLRELKPTIVLPPLITVFGAPEANLPLLVTFHDIGDPKSVARVDPAALDKSFGAGVTLRRITVAVTDEPVTTGIEKRLGWLKHLERYRSDPNNVFTNTLPSEIGALRSQ